MAPQSEELQLARSAARVLSLICCRAFFMGVVQNSQKKEKEKKSLQELQPPKAGVVARLARLTLQPHARKNDLWQHEGRTWCTEVETAQNVSALCFSDVKSSSSGKL